MNRGIKFDSEEVLEIIKIAVIIVIGYILIKTLLSVSWGYLYFFLIGEIIFSNSSIIVLFRSAGWSFPSEYMDSRSS